LNTYPNSQLADNAQYWLGEAYYVNKAFRTRWRPSSGGRELSGLAQTPDAQVKIGYCDYELKQFPAARDALAQVARSIRTHPRPSWRRQRLEKMASEAIERTRHQA
jgi:TolA-binding protein